MEPQDCLGMIELVNFDEFSEKLQTATEAPPPKRRSSNIQVVGIIFDTKAYVWYDGVYTKSGKSGPDIIHKERK